MVFFLIAVIAVSIASPEQKRRSIFGLGLGHNGVVVLGGGRVWGSQKPGIVVPGPVIPPVAMVGPNSGPTAVVGPSAGTAVVSGPSGTVVSPNHGPVGLAGLGHPAFLPARHGLW